MTKPKLKSNASIVDLAAGDAIDKLNAALEDLAANVMDPNTDALKPRTILLKVTVKPGQSREHATVKIDCATKLAPVKTTESMVFFSQRRDGSIELSARDVRQGDMFDGDEDEKRDPMDYRAAAQERKAQ